MKTRRQWVTTFNLTALLPVSNNEDKYLLLTQNAPPHPGAAARRIQHLMEKFSRHGSVYVIRRAPVATPPLAGVATTTNIVTTDVRTLTGAGATLPTSAKSHPLIGHLLPLRQSYPFLYLTDNGGPTYRRRALSTARELIHKESITHLFSSFRPWSDHLVARQLKKEHPHLHWIADFRDLPVDPVRRDVWWPALQTWWGKRVIKRADEVWCVSEGQRAQLAGWHPNIKVVRNALLRLPPEGAPPPTDRFTITYTGSLYPHLQTAQPLINSLEQLLAAGVLTPQTLLLVYRGKDAETFQSWCAELPAESLDIQPSIAPAASQELQREANLLLLLNWSAPGYYGVLTAKLWDYLASGRQILALVNGPQDPELQEIVEGAAAGAVFSAKEQNKVDRYLRTAVEEWWERGTYGGPVNVKQLAQYL